MKGKKLIIALGLFLMMFVSINAEIKVSRAPLHSCGGRINEIYVKEWKLEERTHTCMHGHQFGYDDREVLLHIHKYICENCGLINQTVKTGPETRIVCHGYELTKR